VNLGRGALVRVGVGLGVAGVGVLGGVVAERALVRRIRDAPDAALDDGEVDVLRHVRVVSTSDGAQLRVIEAGAGRPIVLLHGVTLAAEVWHYQLADLAVGGYRVVALDQRGHGGSDTGTQGLSLARLARDVAEVLVALELVDVTLVGHSMGGMVALRLLADDLVPGRMSGLGLVATSASPVHDSGIPGARAVAALARPVAARTGWLTSRLSGNSLPGNDLALLATRMVFGDRPSPSQVALTATLSAAVPARVAADLLLDIAGFDDLAALARIDLPATVVVGTADLLTPRRHAEAMAAGIAGAELIVLERCGHMVMLERRHELTAALRRLAERSAGPEGDGAAVTAPAP
jgi:pimeloyl-ACP methyl ester carboxylesterase